MGPQPLRRGRRVVHRWQAHVVFTPKYRRGFTASHSTAVTDHDRVCDDFGAEPVEFNGEHDRVRLLAHYPSKVTLSRVVNSLKGVSARLPRKELPGPRRTCLQGERFWSLSSFAASCGRRNCGDRQGIRGIHRESETSRLTAKVKPEPRKRFLPGVNARGSSLKLAEEGLRSLGHHPSHRHPYGACCWNPAG
ncbi:IS200/IS605 family transposase, partial [Acrocarpospora macrocephala]|uniref:IS200/IS605 family transposase n=1 Tax=Acrocarpospora macrocephala TaxID=150177 RepID=UPI003CD06CE5